MQNPVAPCTVAVNPSAEPGSLRLCRRQGGRELGLDDRVSAPGFVDGDALERAVASALCLVLPSKREGYGLVVEAAARGVPVVLVEGSGNGAAELVEDGSNGAIAQSVEPDELADAIARVHRGGPDLRRSTHSWFMRNGERLSLASSLEMLLEAYGRA